MDPLHAQLLWLKFLGSPTLAPAEEAELALALEADPRLRREFLADLEIDGMLRAYGSCRRMLREGRPD